MNATTMRNSDGPIPEVYLEGLALDVSILDALLKRHRCSHGRTIYFRRMNMVLNRLLHRRKHQDESLSKSIVVSEAVYRLKDLQKTIGDHLQEQNRENGSRKRRHNEKVEEMWDLRSLQKTDGSSSVSSSLSSRSGFILREHQDLIHVWTERIPELLSRILHASKALFVEVGRGFFLPFCTVALSALARIRVLLMEIGVRGLTEIRQLSDNILQILPISDNNNGDSLPTASLTDADYERCMDLFLEIEGDNDIDKMIKQTMRNNDASSSKTVVFDTSALLRSMGLIEPTTKSKSKPEYETNDDDCGVPTTSKETYNKEEDYCTLSSSSVPLEQYSSNGNFNGDGNSAGMDDHDTIDLQRSETSPIPKDSLDRNMELVNKFQKRKKTEKQSDKKRKKNSKKNGNDSEPEALAVGTERKIKRRKSSNNKDLTKKTKKKKAKKAKNDFFDKLFD